MSDMKCEDSHVQNVQVAHSDYGGICTECVTLTSRLATDFT